MRRNILSERDLVWVQQQWTPPLRAQASLRAASPTQRKLLTPSLRVKLVTIPALTAATFEKLVKNGPGVIA